MRRKSNILKSTLITCSILLSCLSAPETQAWQKHLRFKHLSTDDGLSHPLVDSIAQDHQGFMWFGAADGVNKYDGYRFTLYGHDPDDPTSISPGQVMEVYVDSEGVLWAAADELNRFDREKESFTRFSHNPDDPGSINGVVISILEDREGMLWFGTWTQGLNRYDRATEKFTHFQHDPADSNSLPAGPVRSIYEDSDGELWVGTYTHGGLPNLVRFDPESETFLPVLVCSENQTGCAQPLTEADRPRLAFVAGMLEDRSGTLWIGGYGVIRYDKDKNSYQRYYDDPDNNDYPHINNFSGDFVEDKAGLLWFADSFNGLHSFDPESETFNQYLNDPADPDSIGSNDLFTIFEDRDGMIWVGSYFRGISRFNPQDLTFGRYQHDPDDPTSLADGLVQAIAEDANGILWVAAGGLNKIDRSKGVIALYQNDLEDPDSLHNNDIRNLMFDDQGILWLGLVDGLSRFDPATEEFQHFSDPEDDPSTVKEVSSMAKGENGTLWLSNNVSVIHFDPATVEFRHYQPESDTTPESMGNVYNLMRASSGHIWIRSHVLNHLSRFDPLTESFTHFKHDPQDAHSISDDRVRQMYETKNGDIWMATATGIIRFIPESEQFIRFQNEKGLMPDGFNGIVEESNGNLWIKTPDGGLVRRDPSSGEWQTDILYDYDGPEDEFFGGVILSRTGEFILWDTTGINIFQPGALPQQEQDPTVAFTDFRLLNQSVAVSGPGKETPLNMHINSSPDITLAHQDYLLSFEFAALDFKDPMATRYTYKLEGYDQEWIETDATNRIATYTNLPAGDYILRVRASARNGQWGSNTASLKLKILPPPWKSWWAYSLYVATFVLLLFAFIRWRTYALQHRAIELETTVEERTQKLKEHEQVIRHQADHLQELLNLKEKLYANISHEFRTPLTLILGPIRRMLGKNTALKTREQLEMVQRNSERLLRLVDQLLGLSRLSAQKQTKASAQGLLPHVKVLIDSFRPLARDKGLVLIQGESEDIWVKCAPGAMEKMLMNLLSNAIKYTPAGGRITVDVNSDGPDIAVLSVSDTGIGISAEEQEAVFERFHRIGETRETIPGAGIGLALVKELAESYSGSVELVSSPGEGTTVSIRLPRHEKTLQDITKNEAVKVSAAARREVDSLVQPGAIIAITDEHTKDHHRSILIVEDNPDMQNYMQDLLAAEYECLVAGNGKDGLEVAIEQIPDLIVSDVMMPEMDGYEMTQILKEDQRTSHIPIIMLTARSDQESRLKGLREHADDYLTKPFDDEELLLRISNQLAARDIIKARLSGSIYLDEPASMELNKREQAFLNRFEDLLEKEYSNPDLDISIMAARIAVSTRQLQRKLKALTGHSPAEYLRAYRLKKAAGLLKDGGLILGVAMDVGFSSQAYFGTCFKAQFGLTPGQFQQNMS